MLAAKDGESFIATLTVFDRRVPGIVLRQGYVVLMQVASVGQVAGGQNGAPSSARDTDSRATE